MNEDLSIFRKIILDFTKEKEDRKIAIYNCFKLNQEETLNIISQLIGIYLHFLPVRSKIFYI